MSQKIKLGIPDNKELLEALGRLAIAHSNLEMIQIMCIKTLEQLRPHKALSKHRKKRASNIREEIGKLISSLAKDSERSHVKRINELLLDARCHSNRRNSLIHRFFGVTADGTWWTSGDESHWEDLPSIEVINDLVSSIQKTTNELNAERFGKGFIAELSQRSNGKLVE